MPESLANVVVLVLVAHATVGVLFAMVFLAVGIARMDPAAKGAGLRFRLLLAPGCAALWPVLMLRWVRSKRQRGEADP